MMMTNNHTNRGRCGTAKDCRRAGTSQEELVRGLRRLQMLDFSLQELTLYLDMYPDCRRALERYHTLRMARAEVVEALAAAGFPVCAAQNTESGTWRWGEGPWPWEYDFAGNCEA